MYPAKNSWANLLKHAKLQQLSTKLRQESEFLEGVKN